MASTQVAGATTWISVTVVSTHAEAFSRCLFSQPRLQWPCCSDGSSDIDWVSDALMADQH